MALGVMGTDAVPALLTALEDSNPSVRLGAAEALGQIGPDAKDAIGPLTQATHDEYEQVRTQAIESLVQVSNEEAPAMPGREYRSPNGAAVAVAWFTLGVAVVLVIAICLWDGKISPRMGMETSQTTPKDR